MLHINSKTGKTYREEKIGNETFLVVPTTLIVPGVLNGNRGPGYYSAKENGRNVARWNGMPLVAPSHPTVNGSFVSARQPKILDSFGVGYILNAREEDGTLKADAYINITQANKVDWRITWSIYNGKAVEVSTGLDMKRKEEKGVFNEVAYEWVANEYEPDHLAILTDQIGACSLKDGCGLNVNAMSAGQIRTALQAKLNERYIDQEVWVFEDGIYPKKVIYEVGNEYYQVAYTKKHDKIDLMGVAQKVKKVVSYVTANHSDKPKPNSTGDPNMDKAALVDSIINSECDCWVEEDREILNSFEEPKLTKIVDGIAVNASNAKAVRVLEKGMDTDDVKITLNEDKSGLNVELKKKKEPKKDPVVNQLKIEDLPEEFQAAVNFGKVKLQEERDSLINSLLDGKTDDQKKALQPVLNSKNIDELTALQALVPVKKKNSDYSGSVGGPIGNSSADEFGTALVTPTLTFSGE